MSARRTTKNFAEIIRAELSVDLELAKEVAEEFFRASVAKQVYKVRMEANLTQKELAKLAGTQPSVIAQLEDADYDGDLLQPLLRIAFSLKKEVRIELADSVQLRERRRQRSRLRTT
jgi:DNA-binding XRE family transcriptional regulator